MRVTGYGSVGAPLFPHGTNAEVEKTSPAKAAPEVRKSPFDETSPPAVPGDEHYRDRYEDRAQRDERLRKLDERGEDVYAGGYREPDDLGVERDDLAALAGAVAERFPDPPAADGQRAAAAALTTHGPFSTWEQSLFGAMLRERNLPAPFVLAIEEALKRAAEGESVRIAAIRGDTPAAAGACLPPDASSATAPDQQADAEPRAPAPATATATTPPAMAPATAASAALPGAAGFPAEPTASWLEGAEAARQLLASGITIGPEECQALAAEVSRSGLPPDYVQAFLAVLSAQPTS
ncbi:MAG: hypothetical protein HYV63_25275 [Candidatus Schekmanbacteria bacterium]|nr:hypothetical protein [Candidatus Schekmanbacteria bacterium]